jgi:hypothetical protein
MHAAELAALAPDVILANLCPRGGALLVGTGAFTNSHRERIVALAARHALPGIYSSGRFFTEIGGLMSC